MTEREAQCASCGGPILTRRRVVGVQRRWATVWMHVRMSDAEKCQRPGPPKKAA